MTCSPEIAEILQDMLQLGLLRIRSAGWSNDPSAAAAEADHLHNLPSLLKDFSWDRLLYYWDAERPAYLAQASDDGSRAFEHCWQRLHTAMELHKKPSLT